MNNKNEINRRIEQINTENFIWFIYIVLIAMCLCANSYEKKYFYTNNIAYREEYRKFIIVIFIVAIIIYIYFFLDNYKDFKSLTPFDSKRKKNLNELSLFASSLILVSGLIFLYIAIVDVDLDVELAFN